MFVGSLHKTSQAGVISTAFKQLRSRVITKLYKVS